MKILPYLPYSLCISVQNSELTDIEEFACRKLGD